MAVEKEIVLSFGTTCAECGLEMRAGEDAIVYRVGITAQVRHYWHFGGPEEAKTEAATAPRAVASGEMVCPYCGTNTNPKDGVRFAAAPKPGYSLGNHKRAHARAGDRLMSAAEAERLHPEATPAPEPEPEPTPAEATVAPVAPVTRREAPSVRLPSKYTDALEERRQQVVAAYEAQGSPTLYFSKFGVKLAVLMEQAYHADRTPVCLLGDTGTGKTIITDHVARKVGLPFIQSTNLTPATRIEQLVGMPTLRDGIHGSEIVWSPGIVDIAARYGGACVLEEVTRSNETMSRLFSLTDQLGRGLPEPENPFENRVPVHPNFWLVATGNPVKMGYQTSEMDKALKSRFFMIQADEPIADEGKLLADLVDGSVAQKILGFITDARRGGKISPSTRDLVMAAKLVRAGMSLKEALTGAVILKFGKEAEGLKTLMKAYV